MSGISDYMVIIGVITAATLLAYIFLESRRKPQKKEYITKELLICTKCGFQLETNHEPGDFISMIKGKCPKCGSAMKIKAIYAVEKTPSKA